MRQAMQSGNTILKLWGPSLLCVLALVGVSRSTWASPGEDILSNALVGELERAMAELVLEDLPKPYFIQYTAQERRSYNMRASYGGLLYSENERFRGVFSRVRVGTYELDNTNFRQSFGGRATLPLDDNYIALRHALWRMTDSDYKRAVETLASKEAFLKQKNVQDRPDDFSPAKAIQAAEPPVEIEFDVRQWEQNLRLLSGRFNKHSRILNSDVNFFAGSVSEWIVNSQGTRLRKADSGIYVEFRAGIQAAEGMRLSDSRRYLSLKIDQLPTIDKMLADIDSMCTKLVELSQAPVLEHYTGPVLFEPIAAGKVFESLLASRLCANPTPLGSGGFGDDSLEKKIGLRILPRSFQVHDDPQPLHFEGHLLAGSYTYDAEAVAPRKVTLIENGILKTLLASRSPTRKIKESTGHGRTGGFGDARARIGSLYVLDKEAVSASQLKQKLIEAARAEGLDFALRIEAIEASGYGQLGDPVYSYKVYVDDGHEELIRGMEFLPVETRALKHILAAGKVRKVYNSTTGVPSSIIAPAILLEELELNKIEREFDKLPILKAPALRTD